jgi:hypothetical protein
MGRSWGGKKIKKRTPHEFNREGFSRFWSAAFETEIVVPGAGDSVGLTERLDRLVGRPRVEPLLKDLATPAGGQDVHCAAQLCQVLDGLLLGGSVAEVEQFTKQLSPSAGAIVECDPLTAR